MADRIKTDFLQNIFLVENELCLGSTHAKWKSSEEMDVDWTTIGIERDVRFRLIEPSARHVFF